MSSEVRNYLLSLGVAQTRTTPYNPAGNGQCERTNGTLWKTVQLALRSKRLPDSSWEEVLPDSLNSMRSLLCTATNSTPHERLFQHQRRSATGATMPSWLLESGQIFLKRHVRNKADPLGDVVMLLEANPQYAKIQYDDGRQSTVSIKDVTPMPFTSSPLRDDIPRFETTSSDLSAEETTDPDATLPAKQDIYLHLDPTTPGLGTGRPKRITHPPERLNL